MILKVKFEVTYVFEGLYLVKKAKLNHVLQ